MLKLLGTIVNTISAVISLVTGTIKSFVILLLQLPDYINFLTTSIGFLPVPVLTFALITVSLFVVLFLINR